MDKEGSKSNTSHRKPVVDRDRPGQLKTLNTGPDGGLERSEGASKYQRSPPEVQGHEPLAKGLSDLHT